ncbi:MAG: P-loop NTPase [Proteobacteria bacterium]|nr:P-loop NTPase [Pseudomonadota bacterium]
MKLAISGKGGVGKSTLSAMLALAMAKRGQRVLAVDADPDANLALAMGMSTVAQKEIVPISRQKALIEERTGAKVKQYGQMFKLNPEVSDIADKYAVVHQGVALVVLGAIDSGGGGCACPENVILRALVQDFVLRRDDVLILDMEAGVEHLGRATAKGVDLMIIVVEPGRRSVDSALRIKQMAEEIGVGSIKAVANKVASDDDLEFINKAVNDLELIGFIPFSPDIRAADRDGNSAFDSADAKTMECFDKILERLEEFDRRA